MRCAFKTDGAASALIVKLKYGSSVAPGLVHNSSRCLCALEQFCPTNTLAVCMLGKTSHVGSHTITSILCLHTIFRCNTAPHCSRLRTLHYAASAAGNLHANWLPSLKDCVQRVGLDKVSTPLQLRMLESRLTAMSVCHPSACRGLQRGWGCNPLEALERRLTVWLKP